MFQAYDNIFRRCGLRFRAVEADTGEIGGKFSHEFMVLADTGEDVIISCDTCGYAANLERAEVGGSQESAGGAAGKYKKVETPGKRRVEEVAEFLGVPARKLVKTLLFTTDRGTVGVLVAGDREVNPVKAEERPFLQIRGPCRRVDDRAGHGRPPGLLRAHRSRHTALSRTRMSGPWRISSSAEMRRMFI